MRNRHNTVLLACVACLMTARAATAVLATISPPTDDVYIASHAPDTNFHYDPEYQKLVASHSYIGPYDTHSLLKFDLAALPDDAAIISAALEIYCIPTSGYELVSAYRMGHDGWDESTATWNNFLPYMGDRLLLDITSVEVPYEGAHWVQWDLSGMNWQADLNDKLLTLMMTADAASMNYFSPPTMASKEYRDPGGQAFMPRLTIEYVPEPASLSLLALGGMILARRRRSPQEPPTE